MNLLKLPKKSRSGGALSFIFICLLLSGLFRIAQTQGAIAQEVVARTGAKTSVNPTEMQTGECQSAAHTGPLLQAIREQQELLDIRELRFADRVQALNVAENKLKANIKSLQEAEQKLAATLAIADAAAENDLARLTAVYENMKAKNAAGLFSTMAPEFAAGFLGRMRSDSAAAIMSSLEPEKAYAISLVLAGRNARAPRE